MHAPSTSFGRRQLHLNLSAPQALEGDVGSRAASGRLVVTGTVQKINRVQGAIAAQSARDEEQADFAAATGFLPKSGI